ETPEQLASSRLVSVSYAEGCCEKSKERNRHSAYDNGIDEVRMYNWSTLDADWRDRNSAILSLPRGAGYWMWKPYVILDTLLDKSLPWFSSVVLYLDAGNHYIANPRTVVGRALLHTDVAAPLLKCCLESDWAKRDAIRLLAPAEPPAIVDRPQNAAYFLIFRKTPVAVDFVRRWLRACEDYRVVTDHDNVEEYPNYPTFTRHVHDQTAFSILFKLSGFTPFDLDDAHRVMNLSRSLTKCQMLPITFLKRACAPPFFFFLLYTTSSAEDSSPKVSLASPAEGPQTLAQIRSIPDEGLAPETGNTSVSASPSAPSLNPSQIRRLSVDSLASLPYSEERVYSVVTQSDAIKGIRKYIMKGEYLPCDYEGCFLYACGYCKKTSGILSTRTYTCPTVTLSRDGQRRTVMRTLAGDFCELAPKEKLDHFGDRTCPSILSLGKSVPPAQQYSERTVKWKPYKGSNPRVMSKFRAEKEDDIAGKLPVLKDGTVDCTRLLLHFGVDDSAPSLNPMLHPGGAGAFPFADPESPPAPATAPQATGENPQAASSNLPLAQTRDAMLNSNAVLACSASHALLIGGIITWILALI
ncbi:hypothetical protein FOZ63_019611, partial [Perkinsus olseni]